MPELSPRHLADTGESGPAEEPRRVAAVALWVVLSCALLAVGWFSVSAIASFTQPPPSDLDAPGPAERVPPAPASTTAPATAGATTTSGGTTTSSVAGEPEPAGNVIPVVPGDTGIDRDPAPAVQRTTPDAPPPPPITTGSPPRTNPPATTVPDTAPTTTAPPPTNPPDDGQPGGGPFPQPGPSFPVFP